MVFKMWSIDQQYNLGTSEKCKPTESESWGGDPVIWVLTSPLGNSEAYYGLRTIVLKCRVWQGRAALNHIKIVEHKQIMLFEGHHELMTLNFIHFTSGKICPYFLYVVFCISKCIHTYIRTYTHTRILQLFSFKSHFQSSVSICLLLGQ